MAQHEVISPRESADRLAIRELVEAYAYCADRRDAAGQMALFTPDSHFVVYMDAKNPAPSQELHSREALAPVFDNLNQYHATMHFVGQSTITSLTTDKATGQAYCLAHHLTLDGDRRHLMITPDNFQQRRHREIGRPHEDNAHYSSARFAALVYFLITRSRLSLEMWSMNKTPLMWSISCCRTVARNPFASISCVLPSRSM